MKRQILKESDRVIKL